MPSIILKRFSHNSCTWCWGSIEQNLDSFSFCIRGFNDSFGISRYQMVRMVMKLSIILVGKSLDKFNSYACSTLIVSFSSQNSLESIAMWRAGLRWL